MTRDHRPCQWLYRWLLLAAIGVSGCAPGDQPPRADGSHSPFVGLPVGRIEVGLRLAERKNSQTQLSCSDCHGPGGNEPTNATYPRLGGQPDDYLAYALLAYRRQSRAHPVMQWYAHQLSDQEIADLAVYFGAQPSRLHPIAP